MKRMKGIKRKYEEKNMEEEKKKKNGKKKNQYEKKVKQIYDVSLKGIQADKVVHELKGTINTGPVLDFGPERGSAKGTMVDLRPLSS